MYFLSVSLGIITLSPYFFFQPVPIKILLHSILRAQKRDSLYSAFIHFLTGCICNVKNRDMLYLYTPGEREIGVVGFHFQSLVHVLNSPEEIGRVLSASPANYVLIREKLFDELVSLGSLPSSAEVAARVDISHRNQLLLRGRQK